MGVIQMSNTKILRRAVAFAICGGIALSACGSSSSGTPSKETSASKDTVTEQTEPASTDTTIAGSDEVAPATTFTSLDDRAWRLLVKNPDGHVGEGVKVAGMIFQFDSFTGTDNFLAAAFRNKTMRANFTNASDATIVKVTGDEKLLADFLAQDNFVCDCTVLGSYSYTTKSGGTNNAVSFRVESITHG